MDSNRPTAVPLIGSFPQSLFLQNNCALKPFPLGMPYASMDFVIGGFARQRIPFFLQARAASMAGN